MTGGTNRNCRLAADLVTSCVFPLIGGEKKRLKKKDGEGERGRDPKTRLRADKRKLLIRITKHP